MQKMQFVDPLVTPFGGYGVQTFQPGDFEAERHYYPRVLNASIHPLVRYFLSLSNERIIARYCHLHPEVNPLAVTHLLNTVPRHFRWGGTDLFQVETDAGTRRTVVIETNSSPSGQKSMPLYHEAEEFGGFGRLIMRTFLPSLRRHSLPPGGLAVLYDKNYMEASGYAAVMAELTGEPVHLVPFFEGDTNLCVGFTGDGVLQIRKQDAWLPIRAALRYVTQKPWTRIPPVTRTLMLNPVLVCLAGGRNKMLAAKAYELFNREHRNSGLQLHTPDTISDLSKEDVPMWVERLGGFGVVKVPYANAGQGVYTITSSTELKEFMTLDFPYDRFIVQSLIGNSNWSSHGDFERLFHLGTIPDKHGHIYVADLRFMVGVSPEGFYPLAIYARRARSPLVGELDPAMSSWDILGTNLSIRNEHQGWISQSERLMLMDNRDFNRLGVALDDLIEAYIQSVMAITAIDTMADSLLTQRGKFRRSFFGIVNSDTALNAELR
ncbi:hypothetical protein NX722_04645 [Endozoicomonas gorgoniicola]|uniref:Uncharacterized protein n=1 Tax=Endozoicomonas gorgoniicola TaxID=1234144 RepID=A0ABT3MS52_9GAMM|nr:hypothetical protein [Endozoicomonas gorgoniicola]MCW7551938.1 hypothetical protein [Endozoicomonas gorgoniicola]